ncbi:MAG: hypothetical protein AAF394_12975, partial [Planctomycetota bacterium]
RQSPTSLSELLDEWTMLNPPTDDALAIQASIRDMENGDTGQPFDEFAKEFQKRNPHIHRAFDATQGA